MSQFHHIIVNDWEKGVTAPQNVVLVSIPSLLDPSLAPTGKHVIHAYTPASEPYDLWEGLDRPTYQQQKEARSHLLWEGIKKIIPDLENRCDLKLIGTPLTHERFLQRDRGTYSPAISAENGFFPVQKRLGRDYFVVEISPSPALVCLLWQLVARSRLSRNISKC